MAPHSFIHSFIHSLVPTRFQPRFIRSYARLAGLADSRRNIDVMSCRPTSSLYTKYKNHLSLEACCSLLITICAYPLVCQIVIILCEYCISRLIEDCCLVFCGCDTFNSPPTLGCRLRVSDPHFAQGSASFLCTRWLWWLAVAYSGFSECRRVRKDCQR